MEGPQIPPNEGAEGEEDKKAYRAEGGMMLDLDLGGVKGQGGEVGHGGRVVHAAGVGDIGLGNI